jgi:hypothetical protein
MRKGCPIREQTGKGKPGRWYATKSRNDMTNFTLEKSVIPDFAKWIHLFNVQMDHLIVYVDNATITMQAKNDTAIAAAKITIPLGAGEEGMYCIALAHVDVILKCSWKDCEEITFDFQDDQCNVSFNHGPSFDIAIIDMETDRIVLPHIPEVKHIAPGARELIRALGLVSPGSILLREEEGGIKCIFKGDISGDMSMQCTNISGTGRVGLSPAFFIWGLQFMNKETYLYMETDHPLGFRSNNGDCHVSVFLAPSINDY